MLPPVGASYHTTVDPEGAVAVAVIVWIGLCSHCVISPPLVGEVQVPNMVSVTAVLVKLEQLGLPVVCDSA